MTRLKPQLKQTLCSEDLPILTTKPVRQLFFSKWENIVCLNTFCEGILHSLLLLLNSSFLLKKSEESFQKEKRRNALPVPVDSALIGLERFRNSSLGSCIAWLTSAEICFFFYSCGL